MEEKKYSKNDVVKTLFSFERMGEDSDTLSSMMISWRSLPVLAMMR